MIYRRLFKSGAALAMTLVAGSTWAQLTPIKFQLDWRFEGPAAMFWCLLQKAISRTRRWMSQWMQAMALEELSPA